MNNGWNQSVAATRAISGEHDRRTANALREFEACLPYRPFVSESKAYPVVRSRQDAGRFPYVQFNPPGLVSWLVFDIDRAPGAIVWIDAGLPPPTFAVSTPPDRPNGFLGTAHLFYRLAAPVPKTVAAHSKPIRYAAAIEKAMASAMGADPGYAGLLAKNPLSGAWHVRAIADRPYALADLARGVDLELGFRLTRSETPAAGLGRNCELFDRLRFWAYDAKTRFASYDAFRAAVLDRAMEYNAFPTPLPISEVLSTAKSVAKWVWNRYTGSGSGRRNRGILGFESTSLSLSERQALGGRYIANRRSEGSSSRLRLAWHALRADGTTPTQAAVADRAGVSVRTAKRYWAALRAAVDKPV